MKYCYLLLLFMISVQTIHSQVELAADFSLYNLSSDPTNFRKVNSKYAFQATHGLHGNRIYFIDSTSFTINYLLQPNDTSLYKDPYIIGSSPTKLFFVSNNNLYVTDGTLNGTNLLYNFDIVPDKSGIIFQNKLFFEGYDILNGWALWQSDGMSGGTYMIKDIHDGNEVYRRTVENFVILSDTLFLFKGFTLSNGYEPFKSDGTSIGTTLISDLYPGPNSSNPTHFFSFNGKVLFSAQFPNLGTECAYFDISTNQSGIFFDLNSGSGSSFPREFLSINNIIYFIAYKSSTGSESHVSKIN